MLQGQLFACGPAEVRTDAAFERIHLDGGAWVDVCRAWMGGTDEVAERLITEIEWRHGRRWMYDRMVDEPRLTHWYGARETLPHPAVETFRRGAASRYEVAFGPVFLNYYRDGRDSVAFHTDRDLRHLDDTLVAILTFGAQRPFLLRPKGGGRSIDLSPASGDLLVMGGACQQTWEHSVPKLARGVGPRISASIRWAAGLASNRVVAPSS